jgi:DNA sulfur modification protein DndC
MLSLQSKWGYFVSKSNAQIMQHEVDQSGVETLDTMEKIRAAKAEILDEYLAGHTYPWVIGYSGGKDSTLLVQLVIETILELAPSERQRPIHIISNDTLVESPPLAKYVDKMLVSLRKASQDLGLPITVEKTVPAYDQTFWVNIIGRGYPPPNRSFRWCTDRMKIQPTSNYILNQVSEFGKVILLIGVRRSESATRAASVKRHSNGERLHPHSELQGCLVFRPIVEFDTNEVWQILLQRKPPWGGSHRDLVTLYRNAQGGECPLVIDKSQAPSCGTSSSRFGCWTCTVVTKDRSMEGLVDSGFDELEPLLDFRDWLAEIRNDETLRMAVRRNGKMSYKQDGSLIPGPYTLAARQTILNKLLEIQAAVGETLITTEEIDIIRNIWSADATSNVESFAAEIPTEA